jgi:hypothetical protein
MAVEPMPVELPEQTPLSVPVDAAGNGFTVTVTLLLFEQPVAVMVSVRVYVVVAVGDTVGFDKADVKPTGLDTHE